jgi:hypothetical protein
MAQLAFIKSGVASDYWHGVALLGTGGAIGATLSIVVHKRFIRGRKGRGVGVIGERIQ